MKRREFIGGLAGAVTWPVMVRAQQSGAPVIGFVRSSSAEGSVYLVGAFRQGLKELGFIEGQNVIIEYRWADDQDERLPALLADLVSRPVALIVGNTPSALAAKSATQTIPIVFTIGGDPIRDGLVANLNRPGANVTGVVFFFGVLGSKRLELLRQLLPKIATIAMLVNPNSPNTEAERRDVQISAEAVGQELIIVDVINEREIEQAFEMFVQRGAKALLSGAGAFLNSKRELVVALAARHGLPAIYAQREAAVAGGLMSYGPSITDAYRQAGIYAGRILKGERPAELPILQSSKFELVVNLRTARSTGLAIAESFLLRADEVIE